MNKITQFLNLLLISLLLANCGTRDKNITITESNIKNGIFSNPYFNIQLNIPDGWTVETAGEVEVTGSLKSDGNTDSSQLLSDNRNIKIANLLTIFNEDSHNSFTPNLIIVAYNKTFFPNLKNEEDYLQQTKQELEKTKNQSFEIKKVQLKSNVEVFCMNNILNVPNSTMRQSHFAIIRNNFIIDITTTYMTDDQEEELERIINTLQIKTE